MFEQAAARGFAPRMRGVRGSYRFDIEGVGSFRVSVDDGALSISEGAGEADCTIAISPSDLMGALAGRINLLTAAMRGTVAIRGDYALAQKFHSILPGPDEDAAFETGPQP
jgi:ubiquinone biosynthesis protein UbiJ